MNHDSKIDKHVHKDNENLKLSINGKLAKIRLTFSMGHFWMMSNFIEQSISYKDSFVKVIYFIYSKSSVQDDFMLQESDFVSASEVELRAIVNYLIESNDQLKYEYYMLTEHDIYERFYIACKNLFLNVFIPIIESSEHTKEIIQATSLHNIQALQRVFEQSELVHSIQTSAANALIALKGTLDNINTNGITRIAAVLQSSNITKLLENLRLANLELASKFDSPAMKALISNIQKIDYGFVNAMTQHLQQFNKTQTPILEQLQTSMLKIGQIFDELDFSMLSYHQEWSEKHDLLLKFEWFYLAELPSSLIDEIYSQRNTISKKEVDDIIVNFFRRDNCAVLKNIVKGWDDSPCFSLRKKIFHESLVNHSRRYYNTSTTLLTIHIEGVITDFVRIKCQTPRYKVSAAISDISDLINNEPISKLTLADWKIYSVIIDKIEEVFLESFKAFNPEATSNNSRDKITHGHAIDKETEVNSLKRFLYLNEIYKLFRMLDSN